MINELSKSLEEIGQSESEKNDALIQAPYLNTRSRNKSGWNIMSDMNIKLRFLCARGDREIDIYWKSEIPIKIKWQILLWMHDYVIYVVCMDLDEWLSMWTSIILRKCWCYVVQVSIENLIYFNFSIDLLYLILRVIKN